MAKKELLSDRVLYIARIYDLRHGSHDARRTRKHNCSVPTISYGLTRATSRYLECMSVFTVYKFFQREFWGDVILGRDSKLHSSSSPTSELYRLSDRRLLAKLVLTFADRASHIVSVTHPCGLILGCLDRSRYYFFQVAPQMYSRGWVDPVPDHYLSVNLVVPEIEPEPLDL
jgi:hypothetical protein